MGELVIVDRIENGMAACEFENRDVRMIALSELPRGIAEGDCLRIENGRYVRDAEETRRRREANIALFRKLVSKD